MTVAYEADGEATAGRSLWILHGIFGSARNWATFGRRLVRPGWRIVRVDLRGHGGSRDLPPPHDLDACGRDLAALADRVGPPSVLVGHSFGGKVVMRGPRFGLDGPAVVIDAPPRAGVSPGVQQVLSGIRAARLDGATRDAVVGGLIAAGMNPQVAAWLSTALESADGALRWRFDLEAVTSLLASYAATDAWSDLAEAPRGGRTFVRGGRSDHWAPAEVDRLESLAAAGAFRLDVLPEAGHWVHVDDPGGLAGCIDAVRLRVESTPDR